MKRRQIYSLLTELALYAQPQSGTKHQNTIHICNLTKVRTKNLVDTNKTTCAQPYPIRKHIAIYRKMIILPQGKMGTEPFY